MRPGTELAVKDPSSPDGSSHITRPDQDSWLVSSSRVLVVDRVTMPPFLFSLPGKHLHSLRLVTPFAMASVTLSCQPACTMGWLGPTIPLPLRKPSCLVEKTSFVWHKQVGRQRGFFLLVSCPDVLAPPSSMFLSPFLGRIAAEKKVLCENFQEVT